MNKTYIDCKLNTITEIENTQDEIDLINKMRLDEEQQKQLDLLKPQEEEIKKAEFEVLGINLLTELGVI